MPLRRPAITAIPVAALALAAGAAPAGAAGAALPLGAAAPVAAHAGHGATAGHGSHGGHERESGASGASADAGESPRRAMGSRATAGGSPATHGSHASHEAHGSMASHGSREAHGSMASMWEVGTASRPLVMRSARGPLLGSAATRNAPGMTSHSTLGAAVVDGLIAARREAAEADAVATRSELTTAQATKKLSKRCQSLIKRKTSRLSKTDRKRRTACLAQRKQRIEDSKTQPAAPTPGVTAPTPPAKGPDPTTAPPATPAPDPVVGEPTPTPTPVPSGPVYGAVGVTATEGALPFKLSRTYVYADIVNFELVNADSQQHDLYIAPADENGEISGPPKKIIGRTNGQVRNTPTRASIDMQLEPGRYRLICTVDGHGKMEVGFTVYAPKTS